MTKRSCDPHTPRFRRRRTSAVIAFVIGGVTALAGVVGTAAPASADPNPTCSFVTSSPDGVDVATLNSNFTGVVSWFIDGQWSYAAYTDVATGFEFVRDPRANVVYRMYLDVPTLIGSQGYATLETPFICQLGDGPSLRDQTITFPELAGMRVGDEAQSLDATADSGLTVTYTATGPCDVDNNTVVATGAGTCTVTAHQSGSEAYNAAADVARSFDIAAALSPQTIEFTQPADMRAGEDDQQLDVFATSGLPVTLTVTDTVVCAIDDTTGMVTANRKGTCEITATQPGGILLGDIGGGETLLGRVAARGVPSAAVEYAAATPAMARTSTPSPRSPRPPTRPRTTPATRHGSRRSSPT